VGAERPAPPGEFGVVGQDEAALPGPQQLAVLGADAAQVAEGAQRLAGVPGAVRLAGVLDDGEAVGVGKLAQASTPG